MPRGYAGRPDVNIVFEGGLAMQLGMIGLGRMGANMVRRLLKGGHQCVVFDMSAEGGGRAGEGEGERRRLAGGVRQERSTKPRAVWLMVPAGAVDNAIADLLPHLERRRHPDRRRQFLLRRRHPPRQGARARSGIHYVDVGTSGGVWGLERGYCMMIGGEADVGEAARPDLRHAAPGRGDIPRTPGREQASAARPNRAICIAGRTAPAISSRWCTTASNTA